MYRIQAGSHISTPIWVLFPDAPQCQPQVIHYHKYDQGVKETIPSTKDCSQGSAQSRKCKLCCFYKVLHLPSWICKRIIDDGKTPYLPYKCPMGNSDFFRPYMYVFDEYYDCVICPENHVLKYSTTNRDGYREFKSKSYICEKCASRSQCTNNSKCEKTVIKHLWNDYLEIAEDIRHTDKHKELYAKRKETIERVFADAKEKHAMRYTNYRGLSRVTNWVRLKFAAMNLKKYAIYRWEHLCRLLFQHFFTPVFA